MINKISCIKKLRYIPITVLTIFFSQHISAQSVEVLKAQLQESYYVTKEFPGILHPRQQSKISFEIPGKVASIFVDIGDDVKKGQVLAELDSREITAQLKQAKARFDLSKLILKRVKDLMVDGHVSDQQMDEANSEFLSAQSQYEFYLVKLDQTKLVSPFNGVVQSRYLDSGTVINSGAPILDVIDSDYVEAHVTLPIAYLDKLNLNEEYEFKVGENTYNALLTRVAPMSRTGSNSKLAIFQFDQFISPGVVTKLKLKIEENAKGLWVPLKSLSQSDQGLWSLYTIRNNIVTKDLVEIIYFDDNYAFVNGTIVSGDSIILGGASKIVQGKVLDSQ